MQFSERSYQFRRKGIMPSTNALFLIPRVQKLFPLSLLFRAYLNPVHPISPRIQLSNNSQVVLPLVANYNLYFNHLNQNQMNQIMNHLKLPSFGVFKTLPTSGVHSFQNIFKGLLGVFALLVMSFNLQAQSPVFHQGWTALEESPNYIDVSYSVMECNGGSPEIFLHVFNENPKAQSVNFTITIVNPATSQSTKYSVKNLQMDVGEMTQAECGSLANQNLKVALPKGYDPAKVTLSITYP